MSDENTGTIFEFASNTTSLRRAMDKAADAKPWDEQSDRLFGGTEAEAVALAIEFNAVVLFWNKEAGVSKRVDGTGKVTTR